MATAERRVAAKLDDFVEDVAVLVDGAPGLPAVEIACAEALDQSIHSADVFSTYSHGAAIPVRR